MLPCYHRIASLGYPSGTVRTTQIVTLSARCQAWNHGAIGAHCNKTETRREGRADLWLPQAKSHVRDGKETLEKTEVAGLV